MAKQKKRPAKRAAKPRAAKQPVKRAAKAKKPAKRARAKAVKPRKPARAPKPRTTRAPTSPATPRAKRGSLPPGTKPRREQEPTTGSPTGNVVQILDADRPVDALRAFLAEIQGNLSVHQGQIALGAAQLVLLHRGEPDEEVRDLIDLVLARWADFPERAGFHAQELLRNALAVVGEDRDRLAQLATLVPIGAEPELRVSLAAAHAAAGDRTALLRAVESALAAGAERSELARHPGIARFADDDALRALLDRETPPQIPVDLSPYLPSVRIAIEAIVKTLREYGETVKLEPPATLDAIAAAERARGIQLPNDYRALLAISDGMTLWDHQFFGTLDYRTETKLARAARDFLDSSMQGSECVPLAGWGQANDWLLYDPYGRRRGGEPGVVLVIGGDEHPLDGITGALEHFDALVRDVLGTN